MGLYLHFFMLASFLTISTIVPLTFALYESKLEPCEDCPEPISFDELFEYFSENKPDDEFQTSAGGLNPILKPEQWVALGDSYAAGPGAGDTVKDSNPECVRGSNAYPFQMQDDNAMPGPSIGIQPLFTFKACTGDETVEMLDENNKNNQLGAVTRDVDFVTLSIVGNDVQFAPILKSCVFGLSLTKCDAALKKSREILYGKDLFKRYTEVLQRILDRMQWRPSQFSSTVIYQSGYSQFFDVYTKQCDEVGFLPGGIGPRITQDLRFKLNQLTHEVNYVIQYYIDLFNAKNTVQPSINSIFTVPVHFANVDRYYNRHRFCRSGVTEPDTATKDTWFFHISGRESGVESDEEQKELMEKYYAEPITETVPEWVIKTFHPTSRGFRETKEYMLATLSFKDAARRVASEVKTFPVMVVGDYVAYASQDPNSDIYQGFIPHLQGAFRDARFYGWPVTVPYQIIKPSFVGGRIPHNYNGFNHECWQSATLKQLAKKVSESPDLHKQNKVVILMAGTIDVMYGIELDTISERVVAILDIILEADPQAVILLGQIPLVGLPKHVDALTWPELSQRIVTYNAQLAQLANYYVTRKLGYVHVVHTSATPLEHTRDLILPNKDGYRRMGNDFAEAIVWAGASGLIKTDPAMDFPQMVDMVPDPDHKVEPYFNCHAREDVEVEQGTKEEIRDSYLNHLDIDEYIEKIGCNRTEICRVSGDGVHGEEGNPSALSLNATDCSRSGGEPGKPDNNVVHVWMPADPTYDLADSECGEMIKEIIDECIMKQNGIGGLKQLESGMHVSLQGGYLDKKSTALRDYEADFIDNDVVTALLEQNVALPALEEE